MSDVAAVALGDRREVDLGIVDAVEDVGEHGGGKGEANVDELRVAVAGGLNRDEILVADGAAGARKLVDESDQRIALGITGGPAIADLLHNLRRQPDELCEMAVGGDTIVTAGGFA